MDPLDLTGLVLVRFANLYWLVTVSGFQGSSCSRFRLLPAVLPAACRLCCVRRQGDTLRIRLSRVNRLSELFFGTLRAKFISPDPGSKERLPTLFGGAHRQLMCRITAASRLLCDQLRTAFRFQHALRSPVWLRRCGVVLYTAPNECARGISITLCTQHASRSISSPDAPWWRPEQRLRCRFTQLRPGARTCASQPG